MSVASILGRKSQVEIKTENGSEAQYLEELSRRISIARETDLLRMSMFYDLEEPDERLRSAEDLASLFFDLCECVKPKLFIEAGAFSADASREYKRRDKKCRVVAFEANPHSFKLWNERVNFKREGVEYIFSALSDGEKKVTFNVPKAFDGKDISLTTGRSSLLERTDSRWEYEKVTVPAVTLNDFFARANANNVVWMDVEGASRQVLSGGNEVLKKTDLLLIEVEETRYWSEQWLARDVIEYLEKLGLYLLARDFESPSRRQYNMLFCRSTVEESHFAKTRILNYYNRVAFKRRKSPFQELSASA
ncbi:FkbM family methyltransferase [Sinorhizobium medicae]|uniref:FkbM family methyltransferase n=1 Tax=Sinorhizobium medicae TaxID=110321 RepID=UPI000FD9F394|nr:FkbM family methyltransferase [Sinorhizobium medicae]MDX0605608.1 FkbM family methyltransferase [Sinorhizobium medicae]MDX0821840.1 FkbM family methyltransferase [Sinorhizobium medicae]MDX0864894.1 FkbM family methyltransferase [Sinorhizobium medicae]RVJ17835.1 FkbM family methyltransferase [Sinorhizobium medicae]